MSQEEKAQLRGRIWTCQFIPLVSPALGLKILLDAGQNVPENVSLFDARNPPKIMTRYPSTSRGAFRQEPAWWQRCRERQRRV